VQQPRATPWENQCVISQSERLQEFPLLLLFYSLLW
jgi:hypothetical protein